MSALFGRSLRRVHDPARHAPGALRLQPAAPMDLGPLVELSDRVSRSPRRGLASQVRAPGGRDHLVCRQVHAEQATEPPGQNRQSRPGLELPEFQGT